MWLAAPTLTLNSRFAVVKMVILLIPRTKSATNLAPVKVNIMMITFLDASTAQLELLAVPSKEGILKSVNAPEDSLLIQ
jgi:hypothetical protein